MSNYRIYLAFSLILSAVVLLISACADSVAGCQSSSDCRSGRICVSNICVDGDLPDLDLDQGLEDMSTDASGDGVVEVDFGLDQGRPDMGSDMVVVDMPNDMPMVDMGMDMPPVDMPADMPPADMPADMPPADMPADMPMVDMPADMPMTDMGMDMPADMNPGSPQIEVTPTQLDFGGVIVNASATAAIQVRNIGTADLVLTSVDLGAPSTGFSVSPVVTAAAPLTIAPNATTTVTVTFAPTQQANYQNRVEIDSNDTGNATVIIPLRGRGRNQTQQSCFFAAPDSVDFGTVAPGTTGSTTVTIGNCSQNQNVTVTQASVLGMNSPFAFTLSQPTPFVLTPGTTQTVTVTYTPTGAAAVADTLRFRSDGQIGTQEDVDLFGNGGGCIDPIAQGSSRNDVTDAPRSTGILIGPLDAVILDASQTQTPSGAIDATWTVTQAPAGSTASVSSNNQFTPDVVGEYELTLDVTDPNTMTGSCAPATLKVVRIQGLPAIRATLTWIANHDLDLHLVRDDANGAFNFFDPLNDAHYDNLNPDWGVAGVATDDAFHQGDDTNGFGPETVDLAALEPGRKYRLVVQFARRQGFQPMQFTANLSMTVASSLIPMARNLSHTFQINQIGTYWITFEVDGTTGAITNIDMTQ